MYLTWCVYHSLASLCISGLPAFRLWLYLEKEAKWASGSTENKWRGSGTGVKREALKVWKTWEGNKEIRTYLLLGRHLAEVFFTQNALSTTIIESGLFYKHQTWHVLHLALGCLQSKPCAPCVNVNSRKRVILVSCTYFLFKINN